MSDRHLPPFGDEDSENVRDSTIDSGDDTFFLDDLMIVEPVEPLVLDRVPEEPASESSRDGDALTPPPASDTPASDTPGIDTPASDTPGIDTPGIDTRIDPDDVEIELADPPADHDPGTQQPAANPLDVPLFELPDPPRLDAPLFDWALLSPTPPSAASVDLPLDHQRDDQRDDQRDEGTAPEPNEPTAREATDSSSPDHAPAAEPAAGSNTTQWSPPPAASNEPAATLPDPAATFPEPAATWPEPAVLRPPTIATSADDRPDTGPLSDVTSEPVDQPTPVLAPPTTPAPIEPFAPPRTVAEPEVHANATTETEDLPGPIDELLDADGSVVVVLDRDGSVRTVNHVARRVLGAASTDQMVRGSAAYSLLRSLLDHVPRHLLESTDYGTWQGDFDHTDPVGRARVFRATVAVRPEGDDNGYIAVIAHDVTTARAESERLRHRSTHDALTGLANRRQVLAILEHAVGRQRGRPGHVATLFIDLDRLKYVNDALGHGVGDRLLVSTAARLAEAVRPNDTVARIGGDEFLVACGEMPDTETALELAERVRQALSGRLRVRELDLEFSVSVGIALTDPETLELGDEAAASALISNADSAMYEAKRTGRGRSVLFTSQMRSAARERSELATALAKGIAQNELTIEYQPVYSAVTRKVSATEALVRWNHPDRGWIDPGTFVAVAEESGSIGRLGEFVLRNCLGDLRAWIAQGLVADDFAVHVNVSRVQLASTSFVHQVQSILREFAVAPSRLVLEARESALVSGNADIQRSVRTLRRLGVGIAVDNFGTGANALSVLTDVGADFLKLDGSLALPSGSSDADIRLVRALVLLAHALDMQVVAEKVSGVEQLKHLQASGCDYVQGHLLGTPAPNEGHHPAPLWPLG